MANNLKKPGKVFFAELAINLDEVSLEQLDHYIAVENYLTDDEEPSLNASNLEQVSRYLNAFHHLCEVEDWKRASKILFIRLDTPTNEELHAQLNTWGYYKKQIELYNRIVGKISPSLDTIFFMV